MTFMPPSSTSEVSNEGNGMRHSSNNKSIVFANELSKENLATIEVQQEDAMEEVNNATAMLEEDAAISDQAGTRALKSWETLRTAMMKKKEKNKK